MLMGQPYEDIFTVQQELIFWDMVQAKVQGANVVEVVYPYCLSWPKFGGGVYDGDEYARAIGSIKACFGIGSL
ncbi:hypothetical protein P8452_46850 [Trifolium repens]|nr:hypothetical protein P8452_46850 [Trifolium repens]